MNAQSYADKICAKRGVPPITVEFSERGTNAQGAYITKRYKGSINHIPHKIVIYMPAWFASKHPDEYAYILAHELAHHETNVKKNSLRHTKEHSRLTRVIEKALTGILI